MLVIAFEAAFIAVYTFALVAEGPGATSATATINLSKADLALDQYVVVMTEGESIGLEQLFLADFNQKIQASNYSIIAVRQLLNP